MKLFYYLDFVSYAQRGSSVSGDVYYKLPYGPVPFFIRSEVNNITLQVMSNGIKNIDIGTAQLSKSISVEQKRLGRYKALLIKNVDKNYSLNSLSSYEIELLKKIVSKFKKSTAKFLTEKTHNEKPYLLTSENSVIDYKLALTLDLKSF